MADQKGSSHNYPLSTLGGSAPSDITEIQPLMMNPPFPDDEPPPYSPYVSAKAAGIRSASAPSSQQQQATASSNLLLDHDITDSRNLTADLEQQPTAASDQHSRRAKLARSLAEGRNMARVEQAAAISSAEHSHACDHDRGRGRARGTTYKRGWCGGKRKWWWLAFILFILLCAGGASWANSVENEAAHHSNSTSNATSTSASGSGSATPAMPVALPTSTDV